MYCVHMCVRTRVYLCVCVCEHTEFVECRSSIHISPMGRVDMGVGGGVEGKRKRWCVCIVHTCVYVVHMCIYVCVSTHSLYHFIYFFWSVGRVYTSAPWGGWRWGRWRWGGEETAVPTTTKELNSPSLHNLPVVGE